MSDRSAFERQVRAVLQKYASQLAIEGDSTVVSLDDLNKIPAADLLILRRRDMGDGSLDMGHAPGRRRLDMFGPT